ncbi:MAG: cupin domain-containing protein [Marivibrio sp.]|uniref:cupin domain-containing protein n=1 Tax=Marivibrio sp. TaxID=2039719 RepID=UPI0032EF7D05
MTERLTLADILAPMSEEEFFAEHYDKKPAHIEGGADKFRDVMNFETLNALLNMRTIWSPDSLMMVMDRTRVPAAQFFRRDHDVGGGWTETPDPAAVTGLIRQGASLVANGVENMTEGLRQVADAIEEALAATVQANIYYSGKQRQAFTSHFDTHEVFAMHVAGEKRWRLYETRLPHPIYHPKFMQVSDAQHEAQRGGLYQEVLLKPGDLLYIPRGWYHDALASSDASLHLAVGATGTIGIDAIDALREAMIDDEAFRLNRPRPAEGREAVKRWLADLGDRLKRTAEADAFVDAFLAHQDETRKPRGGFALPTPPEAIRFTRRRDDLSVQDRQGTPVLRAREGDQRIPPTLKPPLAWILQRRAFDRADLLTAFPDQPVQTLDEVLRKLEAMKAIERTAGA